MKKPVIAFILSVFIPGLGLAYLGRWIWAVVNFVLFVAVIFILPFTLAALSIEISAYPQSLGLPLALFSGLLAFIEAERIKTQTNTSD
jgi:hypothetical protein